MRKLLAVPLGLVFATGLALSISGLWESPADASPAILAATDGGVAASVALAKQGLVVPPAIEDVEEMCALLIGCPDVPLQAPSQDLGECVRVLWKELAVPDAVKFSIPLRECGFSSNSCKDLRECALRGAAADGCSGRGTDKVISYCDSDGRALTCSKGKILQVRDCPRFGEQCAAKGGHATCHLGACPKDVPEDGTPTCSQNGKKVFVCDKDAGKLLSFDCSGFGLSCGTGPDGKATCLPEASSKCEKDLHRCDGEDHVGCVAGREVKVQCSKAGMKCSEAANKETVGMCIPPAADEKDACNGAPSKCVGNDVVYCAGGKTRKFFCKGLGFAKCTGGPGQAHCVP